MELTRLFTVVTLKIILHQGLKTVLGTRLCLKGLSENTETKKRRGEKMKLDAGVDAWYLYWSDMIPLKKS